MALKGHLISGGLVGPLAGIESGSANDIAGFDGSSNAVSRSLSATLDAVIGNTKGTIIKRGDSAWEKLDPADGYLKSASGVLSWGAIGSSTITDGTPLVLNPYANSTTTTQAHGLGVIPFYISFAMECLTSELGWTAGEVVRGNLAPVNGTIQADATNVILVTQTSMNVVNKSTHIAAGITPANWKITLTPYKLT